MATITIQNLSKQYKGGEVQALRDVSLECPDGKFFCLLGPAGAGKTTTIKLIAGTELSDSGKIIFDGVDVTDKLPQDRDIAVAFETYALYPQRTVRENLLFPLQAPIRKNELSAEASQKRVVEIANVLGIGELLDRLPRQLSGGQRQRVALGRALVRKPKAYLLDEPIAHLDAKLRHRMRGELKRIQMELGITTLYTTPDQLEALSLADTIAVLNNGKIEQVGTPEEIYKKPVNMFVAQFVGDPPMNVLEAELQGDEIVVHDCFRLPSEPETRTSIAVRAKSNHFLYGIRPKDIQLVPVDSENALLRAETKHVQVLGETTVLTLNLENLDLRVKIPTHMSPNRGEPVGLWFNPASSHFFDVESKLRMDVQ